MESEVDARAREAAENTVEHLLEMLHDGRITFEDMKAAAQRDEAIFFNRPDFSDKYFAHRDSYIEEKEAVQPKNSAAYSTPRNGRPNRTTDSYMCRVARGIGLGNRGNKCSAQKTQKIRENEITIS
ncbi:CAD protein [Frankliniella fusca]|uniref:CAD protein n=1 Tax=Frankliniella fusca TaxID=407009 RepID=A0AAE1HYS7_9NEOP|nr:CAD protein [Frankliniella fusca]